MTDRSPTRHFDVIVVGAGAMGSAATYQLARRGRRVLALERFQVPHQMGSSHGLTRIIRLAFHEGPEYVPLGHRAYRLWRQLESEPGQSLLSITGSVHAGQPGSVGFEKTLEACRRQGVEHEILTGAQLASRYPGYALPSGFTNMGSLQRLAIANTGICIPSGDAFSDWLGTVADKPGIDGIDACE